MIKLLAATIMALSTLGATTLVTAPAANASTATYANQMETSIQKYVNVQRRAYGRHSLVRSACVDRYSEGWAAHLAKTGRFYHRSWKSIAYGCHRSYASENIAKYRSLGGSADALAKKLVRMWMNSSSHRAALLSSRARLTAVGVRKSGSYWVAVQNFSS